MEAPDPKACPQCEQVHTMCSAHNRARKPCKKDPTPGAAVCRFHGGAAPQVVAKARQRLLEALDPVAAELVRIAKGESTVPAVTKGGDVVDLPPSHAVRVRAIEAIMDRAGLPAAKAVELTGGEGKAIEFRVVMPKDDGEEGSRA